MWGCPAGIPGARSTCARRYAVSQPDTAYALVVHLRCADDDLERRAVLGELHIGAAERPVKVEPGRDARGPGHVGQRPEDDGPPVDIVLRHEDVVAAGDDLEGDDRAGEAVGRGRSAHVRRARCAAREVLARTVRAQRTAAQVPRREQE